MYSKMPFGSEIKKSKIHSSVPNIFARLLQNFTPRTIACRSEELYTAGATPLELHDLVRVRLKPISDELSIYQQKRWLTFDQFIVHEQNYLDAMHKLQYGIYAVLLKDEAIVNPDIANAIFGTHQKICKLHQFIQPLLEVCVKEWSERYLAGWLIWAMLEQPALVPLYKTFIHNYPRAHKLRELGEQRNFNDYFIMPVQRIPQLVLELKEMLKSTVNTDADHDMLGRCVERATLLGEQLNAASGYQCALLHSETLTEVLSNGIGTRLVLLFSDRLVCVKPPDMRSHQPGPSRRKPCQPESGLFGALKWVLPLQDIEMDGGECGVPSMPSTLGSDSLNDFIGYMRDFETLSQVRDLMDTFQQPHESLSQTDVCEELDKIWSTVMPPEDTLDEATLLRVKVKHGKPRILKLVSVDAKKEWCNAIRLGQLALMPENSPAWWNGMVYAPYEPLFVKKLQAGEQDATVTGGCSYVPNTNSSAYSNELFRVWSKQQHVLWISTMDERKNSKICLYTHDRIRNVISERANFTLPSTRVTCMAYVPEGTVGDTPTDTVWITTRTRLLIYSATFPMITDRLKTILVQGLPNRILYHAQRVFVATAGKRLLIFSMSETDVWQLKTPQRWQCGPVNAMTAIGSYVCIAVHAKIHMYDCSTGTFIKKITSPRTSYEDTRYIALLQYSVHGLWVARVRSGIVSLYHPRSYKHLLDIDVGEHITRFQLDNADDRRLFMRLFVISMMVVDDRLWVGTDVGILLSMQLPKHANVPIMIDQLLVAYHGHLQNVNVIIPLPSMRAREETVDNIEFLPGIIETLFRNTRKASRDLLSASVGIDDSNLTFVDACSTYSDTQDSERMEVDEVNVSDEYADGARLWDEDEETSAAETDNHTPWIPDSTLIITGGYGYLKREYKTSPSPSLNDAMRSLSVSNLTEAAGNWNSNKISKNGNLILWETRMS
uniref:DH domain-containing protein n=1 Tax=Anopheles minimus TaxID=112268 RepID=A0A182W4H4_9DIPT